ncbi:MAG: hypothetical protein M3503_01535 [Actinomycetota bacterium]|nr:hypothetical protein [Actinomycetota bacterium]
MNASTRLTSCLVGVALVSPLLVAATTGTAAAEKPVRGCTASYHRITRDELRTQFPNVVGFEALFASLDKNGDDVLCAKQVPGLFNTVDNTANQ